MVAVEPPVVTVAIVVPLTLTRKFTDVEKAWAYLKDNWPMPEERVAVIYPAGVFPLAKTSDFEPERGEAKEAQLT